MNKYTRIAIENIHPALFDAFYEYVKKNCSSVPNIDVCRNNGMAIYKGCSHNFYCNHSALMSEISGQTSCIIPEGDVCKAMKIMEEWNDEAKSIVFEDPDNSGQKISINADGSVTYGCTRVTKATIDLIIRKRNEFLLK